jgi:hypothetical protein
MARLVVALILGLLPPPAGQPPATPLRAAPGDQAAAQAPGPPAPRPDLEIVFWYEERRPLDTFRYQVYDVARGEFTPAVEAWLAQLRARYPRYTAYVRAVDLSREAADTRNHKIGSVIIQEFLAVGTEHGYDFGGFVPGRPPRAPAATARRPPPVVPPPAFRTIRSTVPAAAALPFPTPLPYPRPHP